MVVGTSGTAMAMFGRGEWLATVTGENAHTAIWRIRREEAFVCAMDSQGKYVDREKTTVVFDERFRLNRMGVDSQDDHEKLGRCRRER